MPLVPSPSTGYTDYQTFGNYDSSLLWSIDSFLGTSPVSSPVMNMTKYAALSGFLLCVTNQCQCTITWYGDVGLTQIIASRTFTLTQNITSGFGAMIMPNMGAYAQIVCTNMGGIAFAINTLIFGTNRTSPVIWSPQNSVLIDQQNQPLPGNGLITLYPSDYYAGPLQVFSQALQSYIWTVQYLTSGNLWDVCDQVPPQAAGTDVTHITTTPHGAWRIQIQNNSATATTYYLIATASITGAT